MNQKQLYILMFLLMAIVVIQNRPKIIEPRSDVAPTGQASGSEAMNPYVDMVADKNAPYQLGIALSGGGAKGFCHAGVLKALEENGIKPDVLAGVSAGAVVAALYADGYSPDSIIGLFQHARYRNYIRFGFSDGGFFSMDGFKAFLDTVLRAKTFEELAIPLRVVATDLDKGQSVVFDKGNLVDALVASCSVPILFTPYTIDGVNYVDGGVLQNLPAFAIRKDCKVLLGVSTGPMKNSSYEKTISDIALRSYKFIFRNNTRYAKKMCDYVIEPADMNQYSGADVLDYKRIFNLGYTETKRLVQNDTVMHLLKGKMQPKK